MIQAVSWKQFTELSFREIKDWEYFITGDNFINDQDQWDDIKSRCAPPIEMWKLWNRSNIGNMISFIHEYSFDDGMQIYVGTNENWIVTYYNKNNEDIEFESSELINALWEAVRYVYEFVVDWSED